MGNPRPKTLDFSAIVVAFLATLILAIAAFHEQADAQIDTTPPYVVSTNPADGVIGVSVEITKRLDHLQRTDGQRQFLLDEL
jgi:hypothetical protein